VATPHARIRGNIKTFMDTCTGAPWTAGMGSSQVPPRTVRGSWSWIAISSPLPLNTPRGSTALQSSKSFAASMETLGIRWSSPREAAVIISFSSTRVSPSPRPLLDSRPGLISRPIPLTVSAADTSSALEACTSPGGRIPLFTMHRWQISRLGCSRGLGLVWRKATRPKFAMDRSHLNRLT
jgi:hypothetical protein